MHSSCSLTVTRHFAAFNPVEDGAQLSINSSNKPSDTSIMCSAVANCVPKHNAATRCAFISGTKSLSESVFPYKESTQHPDVLCA